MIAILILNALWEGALIVALTALALRLVPVANATTRYAVWFAGLIALVAVPALTTLVHIDSLQWLLPHRVGTASSRFSLVAVRPIGADAARWLTWPAAFNESWLTPMLVWVWSVGAAFGFVRLFISFLRITQLRREAVEIYRVDGVPVLESTQLAIPIATGVIAPAIVLPSTLAQTLDTKDRRCTIEHELAHLRRGDVASNWIQRIVQAAFFWNPWIYAVAQWLVREREAACDDWAVRRIGEPEQYASCLALLGRRLTNAGAPLLTPSVLGSPNALVARIERLMSERSPNDSKLNYVALGGIAMLFAAMALIFQSLVPAPAQAGALESGVHIAPAFVAAATCTKPNADPKALNPAPPDLPKSQWPAHKVTAEVMVTIAPNGKPTAARVWHSSGDPNVDRAVVVAAKKSTYSPKMVNCAAVTGTYVFRADFAP